MACCTERVCRYNLFATLANAIAEPMRPISILALLIAATTIFGVPARSQSLDDSLEVYAVYVVKTPPFEKAFTGYGVYLGKGYVITAAHVVGHWPFLTHPRVRIGTETFAATVIKEGSFSTTDLALLSIDIANVPIDLQLRRNPLCKDPPRIGMQAIDVLPDKTSRARVINPLSIAPELQRRYKTLIDSPGRVRQRALRCRTEMPHGYNERKDAKARFPDEGAVASCYRKGLCGIFCSGQPNHRLHSDGP